MPELDDVIEWLRKRRESFINARRLARAFKVSTKKAGYMLRKLKESGYLKVHRKRRGRFIVYKVNLNLLNERIEGVKKSDGVKSRFRLKRSEGRVRSGSRKGLGKLAANTAYVNNNA